MNNALRVRFSNRVELLYGQLKSNLFSDSSTAFTQRLIIVASPAMKSWLTLRMAQDPHLKIAAGIEIGYLDESILKLCQTLSNDVKRTFPSMIELALAIETTIKKLLKDRKLEGSITSYLNCLPNGSLTKRGERRLIALSQKLSQLFRMYGIYGGELLDEWESSTDWQETVWNHLFGPSAAYQSLYHMLSAFKIAQQPDLQIHLFSLSFVSALQHRFLTQLTESFAVNYYILSPCQAFWSDIRSDRERCQIQVYWKKKGVSDAQQQLLEEFLRDSNPLLANFGRLGREMAQQIEETVTETTEQYALKDLVEDVPVYVDALTDEVLLEPSSSPLTLLDAVQTDMVLLRNPNSQNRLTFNSYDQSIQVHAAHNAMREIEILYNCLLGLIHKHAKDPQPIEPSDIIVMAPDISEYVPFIKSVFESIESQLDVQINDLTIPSQSTLIQGFLKILSLPETRWEASEIIALFENPSFQKKHFSHEDMHIFREWIQSSGVFWGGDEAHRDELVLRDHCQHPMLASNPAGTWEYGIKQLASGLAMNEMEIDATQGELLGHWVKILRSIRKDLGILTDGTSLSIEEWVTYLSCILEAYFYLDGTDAVGEKAINALWEQFRKAALSLGNTEFPFSSIYAQIEACLLQEHACYRETQLHAIRFCSMLPMRALPAKIVVLLGLQEGAYPRQDSNYSLNLLKGSHKASYCPSRTEFDRFLFLETLLSTRQYFIITYQGYSSEDFKEQPPSLLVSELLGYLDQAYQIGAGSISSHCVHHHPAYSYHWSYFQKEAKYPSYFQEHFKQAKAFYQLPKTDTHRFIPFFKEAMLSSAWEEGKTIELKSLVSVAKNPLKHYLNKNLKVYLDDIEERQIQNEEVFEMSHLELSKIKKASLKTPLSKLIPAYDKKGVIPSGAFKQIALETIQNKVNETEENLSKAGAQLDDIFSIEFSERYRTPMRLENGDWKTPPIEIDCQGQKCKIVGFLKDVSSQGLIEHLAPDKKELTKAWPQFLALGCLIQQYQLPIAHRLIFAKKGVVKEAFFSDAEPLLSSFIAYSITCESVPSPLLPEWVPLILNTDDPEYFKNEVEKSINNTFTPSYNAYLNWLVRGTNLPDTNSLFLHWKETAQQLFFPMLKNWLPKSLKNENE